VVSAARLGNTSNRDAAARINGFVVIATARLKPLQNPTCTVRTPSGARWGRDRPAFRAPASAILYRQRYRRGVATP
jgi:hypothetical protein